MNNANCNANVKLIKGFFNESLTKYPGDKIAILHIDGDLYQSYKDCLGMLYKYVSRGGIVVFDDFLLVSYEGESFPGARKAVSEFLEKENLILCFIISSMAFCLGF